MEYTVSQLHACVNDDLEVDIHLELCVLVVPDLY